MRRDLSPQRRRRRRWILLCGTVIISTARNTTDKRLLAPSGLAVTDGHIDGVRRLGVSGSLFRL